MPAWPMCIEAKSPWLHGEVFLYAENIARCFGVGIRTFFKADRGWSDRFMHLTLVNEEKNSINKRKKFH